MPPPGPYPTQPGFQLPRPSGSFLLKRHSRGAALQPSSPRPHRSSWLPCALLVLLALLALSLLLIAGAYVLGSTAGAASSAVSVEARAAAIASGSTAAVRAAVAARGEESDTDEAHEAARLHGAPPKLNMPAKMGAEYGCTTLSYVCVDEASSLVLYQYRYQPTNPRSIPVPSLHFPADFDWPAAYSLDVFTHAAPRPTISVRPATPLERCPQLASPRFSECTLPLLLYPPWPNSYQEFLARVPPLLVDFFRWFRIDRNATLVLGTGFGARLQAFQRFALQPFSDRRVVTLADLADPRPPSGPLAAADAAGGRGFGSPWAGGAPERCFKQMLVCVPEHVVMLEHVLTSGMAIARYWQDQGSRALALAAAAARSAAAGLPRPPPALSAAALGPLLDTSDPASPLHPNPLGFTFLPEGEEAEGEEGENGEEEEEEEMQGKGKGKGARRRLRASHGGGGGASGAFLGDDEEEEGPGEVEAAGDATEQTPAAVPLTSNSQVLRVVVERRRGHTRTVLNAQELVDACNALNLNEGGFRAGRFSRVECRLHEFGRAETEAGAPGQVGEGEGEGEEDLEAEAAAEEAEGGPGSPLLAEARELGALAALLRDLGMARSVDLIVGVHGPGLANAYLLRRGAGALELRPPGFGTAHRNWPEQHFPRHLNASGNIVHFFALSLTSMQDSEYGLYEKEARENGVSGTNIRDSEAYFARDRHVRPRPADFVAALLHVAPLLFDNAAFVEAQARRSNYMWSGDSGWRPRGRRSGASHGRVRRGRGRGWLVGE
ncbi:hypothetical protein HYH03_016742 [Edaphochlamys debaryana]|uniref:Uncharacterized protein n=1 Tax=Edaphochlamys debaryana TaxID=47281 RepID=A0A835XJQ9_9CHLO|nr:hypothetical protein HYH03_016742 [Edaphochlamys debaryana]|eukprot:KAG2484432.1 hypothetical protein HYH03_016742 [Edaphochlamys debaryana]